ncbi:fused MFS/spermidine synthase [Variovorax paradoxus]|uniref:Integral membrane protein-like protein n=1 Tax=Variovorax paradoxus (strain EPS) TaxID=595537 RepID=E6V162_VARPE|nr:fused MFS/spermidine synthase [Variovorax paradoxus]ADU39085.1 integral membrane protein-like protein [Variovorax paradoxus EPS]
MAETRRAGEGSGALAHCASTIFVSAFLLFLVQPLIARQILPWFGGSAAVWTLCLVFFQVVLLVGYFYADWLSRRPLRTQAIVHALLLLAACAMLPVIPDAAWKPTGQGDPATGVLAVLAATIGLPYLAVCTTGPLVQSWVARLHAGDAPRQAKVYRLFALSNLAALFALVVYPFVLEPVFALRAQAIAWSAGFGLFAVLAIVSVLAVARAKPSPVAAAIHAPAAVPASPLSWADQALWLMLSALGTVALLAVSAFITQDIASVPMLWIVPLALYLLSFVLCFDSDFWYRRWLFWPAVLVLAPVMGWYLNTPQRSLPIPAAIGLFCAGLFAICMVSNGELARARPGPARLTRFYLLLSLGGALGGIFAGVVAPHFFNGYWELPASLAAPGLILLWLVRGRQQWVWFGFALAVVVGFAAFLRMDAVAVSTNVFYASIAALACLAVLYTAWRARSWAAGAGLAGVLVSAIVAWLSIASVREADNRTMLRVRNFYGALRVEQFGIPGAPTASRRLMHGVISHGEQLQGAVQRRLPSTYYGPESGAGLALLTNRGASQRVGVIGLGVGTLAAFGRSGDTFRFYEINPRVTAAARSHFTYLADSAATVEIAQGDARLLMQQELEAHGSQRFDVIVVDAFSGDAIPMHLMTREAMALYRRHLLPTGVIAFHISNRHLALAPVVKRLAEDVGMQGVRIGFKPAPGNPTLEHASEYVLLTNDGRFLQDPVVRERGEAIDATGVATWTDDHSNLLAALQWTIKP